MADDLAHCLSGGMPLDAEASVNLIVRSARKSQRGPSPPPSPAQVISAPEGPGPGRPLGATHRKAGAPNPRCNHREGVKPEGVVGDVSPEGP